MKGRQQRFGFHLGEHVAPLGQHAFNHQAGPGNVGFGQIAQGRRGLLQQLLVLGEIGDIAKRTDGRLGGAEGGDLRLVQHLAGRANGGVSHPAGQQRFGGAAFGFGHRLGHGGAINANARREDDQHPANLRIVQGRFNGQPKMLRLGKF